ncbi:hypothetical protein JXVLWARM_CDS_0013 [Burkholderia phage Bm1]
MCVFGSTLRIPLTPILPIPGNAANTFVNTCAICSQCGIMKRARAHILDELSDHVVESAGLREKASLAR